MGVMTQGGTLEMVLASAWPDPEGRSWAIAHQGLCTFVAWEGFGNRTIYRLKLGAPAEPIAAPPAGLVWEILPQPRFLIKSRRVRATA